MANNPSGRLRGDMADVLQRQPMIASTALFMRHVEHPTGQPGEVAATDGRTVAIWPAFFAFAPDERVGVLLHEYLHAAFAHPLRGLKMRRRLGAEYRHDVMNVSADAIINEGISKGARGVRLPAGGVELAKLAAQAKAVVDLTGVTVDLERMGNVGRLTLEWLYDVLVKLEKAAREHFQPPPCESGGDGESSGNGTPSSNAERQEGGQSDETDDGNQDDQRGKDPSNGTESRPDTPQEKAARDFLSQFERSPDLQLEELSGLNPMQVDDAIREAGERVKSAIAMSKGHGNRRMDAVETLASDIPEARTPWENSFRTITQRHLARERLRRPTKLGLRVMTQEAMGLDRIVWSPGRRRPSVPRVVVVLDSSGSVTPTEYLRYLGEVQAMKRRTSAQVYVVVADTEVQSVQEMRDVRDIAKVEFKGRGGTDFRPALELAGEMEPDLVVYLTDLMGTFPDRPPPFPVLWTLPGMEIPDGYDPPFGRVLTLD